MSEQIIIGLSALIAAAVILAAYIYRKWGQIIATERRDAEVAAIQRIELDDEASMHSHEEPPRRIYSTPVRQIKRNVRLRKRKGRK